MPERTDDLLDADELLARVRLRCLALPDVTERLTHGAPTWFVRRRSFAKFVDPAHHRLDEPFIALWAAGPPGARPELTAAEPTRFFAPRFGGRDWVGMRLNVGPDGPDWDEVREVITDAYRHVAPKVLAARLGTSSSSTPFTDGPHLRLLCPQWQGAGTSSVRELAAEFPFDVARRGYAVGSAVLQAVLPPHDGPTVTAPVTLGDEGLDLVDGVEAKAVIADQLAGALRVIAEHAPARIATLGGECAVSVAPFSHLARRYGDDLAVLWIDSHPDIGTPASAYPGWHAMAVAALTGHGDPDLLALLPATVRPDRVALVGLHEWTDDDIGNVAEWGIRTFAPDDLRASTRPVLDWLAATGCSRVAIHFDVDTVDSTEIVLGLGAVPHGLASDQVRRVVADVSGAAEVVALTIAEFFPRQVMHLQRILADFPLVT